MVRQAFLPVNGKRKQIATHGQKYAVESTYGNWSGHAPGRIDGKVFVREIHGFLRHLSANQPALTVLT
jgi:hypothetical protein